MFLDHEIARLEEEQGEYSLGGPISMTAVGGGTLLGSAYILLIASALEDNCEASHFDGELDTTEDCSYDGTRNVAYLGMVVGAGLTAWGLAWLFKRIPPRRELGRRIDELEKEKKYLEYHVHVAPRFGARHLGLQVHVAF